MKRFIFLEFIDPKLTTFLMKLRTALGGSESNSPAHVTIRGPYKETPGEKLISNLQEQLMGFGVIVGGAGTFSTKEGYVVYLRAQSPVFDELWWKRDYPKESYGINPHITVFKTKNQAAANAVEKFLRSERIEIFTFALVVSVYISKQKDLFAGDSTHYFAGAKRPLTIKWAVKRGILERARKLSGPFLAEEKLE